MYHQPAARLGGGGAPMMLEDRHLDRIRDKVQAEEAVAVGD